MMNVDIWARFNGTDINHPLLSLVSLIFNKLVTLRKSLVFWHYIDVILYSHIKSEFSSKMESARNYSYSHGSLIDMKCHKKFHKRFRFPLNDYPTFHLMNNKKSNNCIMDCMGVNVTSIAQLNGFIMLIIKLSILFYIYSNKNSTM